MTHYYYSLLLGLLGFFIGTSSLTIGMDCSSPSQKIRINQNKRSAFFASDHIIKKQLGEDATRRSNQTALQLHQTTDQIETLQTNRISHQGNYQSNQQYKIRIVMEQVYIILKNGRRMDFQPRNLNAAIELVRRLESGMNRLTDHSPYTIDKIS